MAPRGALDALTDPAPRTGGPSDGRDATRAQARVSAGDIDRWLTELGLEPQERAEREGVVSWDLVLDGRRRFDVRLTLIFAPSVGFVAWVHYAPALSDSFRKSYRRFLRWNDELPFVKFALSEDERPVLTAESAPDAVEREAVGLTVARLLAICDLLLDESADWLWPGGKIPPAAGRVSRGAPLLERYAVELAELSPTPIEGDVLAGG